MGFEVKHNPASADYYAELDVMLWAKKNYGKDFAKHLEKNYEPVDILFRLAELCSVVLLNGGGFYAPEWSVRVSLANLTDEAYVSIAESLKKIVEEYIEDWKSRGQL
ncbi:MAG: hypothetical protein U5Q03_15305 [Bacteroidota bacterium]|nr:hypothetical protein [Bacteroidota bacterium]